MFASRFQSRLGYRTFVRGVPSWAHIKGNRGKVRDETAHASGLPQMAVASQSVAP